MFNIFLISVVMIFFTVGVYFFTKTVTSAFLKNEYESLVVIKTADNHDKIENVVRSAAFANPNSEILVISRSCDAETQTILEKLSQDSDRIHIKK